VENMHHTGESWEWSCEAQAMARMWLFTDRHKII